MIWLMLILSVITKSVREHVTLYTDLKIIFAISLHILPIYTPINLNIAKLLQEACLFHKLGHGHAQQSKLPSETTLIKQTPTMPHTCMNRVVRVDNHSAAAFPAALGSLMAKFAGDITPWLQMTYSARAPEAAICEAARAALQEGPSALSCLVIMTRVCG